MMKIPNRRRTLFVGKIQRRFIAFQVVYFLVFAAVFLTVTFGPLVIDLLDPETPRIEREIAAQQFLTLHLRIWPSLLLVLVLFSFHSLLLSHRFAGPLYRFRQTFERVASGDLSMPVVLRKHDYLKPEAQALEAMIAALREHVRDLAARDAALREEIEQLRRLPQAQSIDLSRLATAEAGMAEALARFRTVPAGGDPCQGHAIGSPRERDATALAEP